MRIPTCFLLEMLPELRLRTSSKAIALHLAFGVAEQVYYCQFDEVSRPSPQAAFRVPNMSLGMRRGPRTAHSQNAIAITAIGVAMGKGRDGDILAYRSLDRGKSWLGPVKVNDVEGLRGKDCMRYAVPKTAIFGACGSI